MPKKLTLIEVPTPLIEYNDGSGWINVGPVVTNTYRPSQHQVSAILKDNVSNLEVKFVDMKSIPNEHVGKAVKDIPSEYRSISDGEKEYAGGKTRTGIIGLNPDAIIPQIKESDYLGFTSNFVWEWGLHKDMYRFAKRINPDVKIIVGGVNATARPWNYLDAGADIVVMGSGLNTGPELFKRLNEADSNKGLEQVLKGMDGVSFVTKTGNYVVGKRQFHDANNMPIPDFDLENIRPDLETPGIERYIQSQDGPLPKGVEGPIYNYRFVEGCYHDCGYCTLAQTPVSRARIAKATEAFTAAKKKGFKMLINGEDQFFARPKKEIMEHYELIHQLGFPHEHANGLNMARFMNRQNGETDYDLLRTVMVPIIGSDGKLSGTFRTYCPIEDPTDQGEKQAKLLSWENTLKLYEAIGMVGAHEIGYGIMISPHHTKADMKVIGERMQDLMQRVRDTSGGATKMRAGVFNEIALPGTKSYHDISVNDQFAFDPWNDPEYSHFFMASVNGNPGTNMSYADYFKHRQELDVKLNGNNAWQETGNYKLS